MQTSRVGAKIHKADYYNTNVNHSQSNNSNLQSALAAETTAVVKADQSISTLNSALKTAREDAEALTVNYATKVTRLQLEKSDLQSTLDAENRGVEKANQSISNLQSDLQTARVSAETHKPDWNTNVTRF